MKPTTLVSTKPPKTFIVDNIDDSDDDGQVSTRH
jgi:hypothetical protein